MSNLIARRGMMSRQGGGRLPAGYQEVEWLKGYNGAYINTEQVIKNTDTLGAIIIPNDTFNEKCYCAPIRWNTNNNRFSLLGKFTYAYAAYGNKVTTQTSYEPYLQLDDNTEYEVKYDGTKFQLFDGILVHIMDIASHSLSWGGDTMEFCLFYGISSPVNCTYKAYYHIRNGVHLNNLVPCYRKSDNVAGMYDLSGSICSLTGTPFYVNAGSGEFIAGPDVH